MDPQSIATVVGLFPLDDIFPQDPRDRTRMDQLLGRLWTVRIEVSRALEFRACLCPCGHEHPHVLGESGPCGS